MDQSQIIRRQALYEQDYTTDFADLGGPCRRVPRVRDATKTSRNRYLRGGDGFDNCHHLLCFQAALFYLPPSGRD